MNRYQTMKYFGDYLFEAKQSMSISTIRKKYNEFNQKLFNGELPEIEFRREKKNLGAGAYVVGNYGTKTVSYMSINPYIEFDNHTLNPILLHEMVHVWMMIHGIKERDAHGNKYKAKVDEINRKTGGIYNVPYKHFDILNPRLDLNFPELRTPRYIMVSKKPNVTVIAQMNKKSLEKDMMAAAGYMNLKKKQGYDVTIYLSKAGFLKVFKENRTFNKIGGVQIPYEFVQKEIIPKSTEVELKDIPFKPSRLIG